MYKIRIPHIWSVGLLLIFMLNISIFPQSHPALDSDLQTQKGTLNPLQEQNQRYQYDTSNHNFMPGKMMSPWTPPTFSGTGTALEVVQLADSTTTGQSQFTQGTSDTEPLILGSGWEGYRIDNTISNLHDIRNWVLNPDFSDTGTHDGYEWPNDVGDVNINDDVNVTSWSFGYTDVGPRNVAFAGNYEGNDTVAYLDPHDNALELHIQGDDDYMTNYYSYDNGDRCYWTQTTNVPRGTVVDAAITFDIFVDHAALFDSWTFSVRINSVIVYARGLKTLRDAGYNVWQSRYVPVGAWDNSTNVFTDPVNGTVDIELRFEYTSDSASYSQGFTDIEYQQIWVDNFNLILTAEVFPSDIGLRMNTANITDGGTWGQGSITETGTWTTSPVNMVFDAIVSLPSQYGTGSYDVEFDYSADLYVRKDSPDTLYELDATSEGTNYDVNDGDTTVDWDFYVYVSVPTGYTETQFNVTFPTDWTITWVSEPQNPTLNNVTQCDTATPGVLTVPVPSISPAPDGYWHIKATSPNYAQSLQTQIEDPPGVWSPATTFRPTNTTRARGTISTSTPNPVNVTWFTPAGTTFYETHPPGAYTLTTGTPISGTVADLQTSDDTDLVIESVGNVIDLYTSYDLDADGIAETDVTNLELWIEAAYNTSITDGDLYVRDFTGGTWEKINDNYAPTTDQAWSWMTANPGAYIDDTTHEIWFRVYGTHSGAFTIGMDYEQFQLTFLNYLGLSGDAGGVVTTPSFTFPTGKTTAGEWTVLMSWTSGTEVAYIAEPFDLNHPSELHSLNSPISAALGDTVTAWVRFNDSDNSQNILTGSVSTSGDGEFPATSFYPNSQFNRWEASFFVDTGFSVGTHTLPISGSAPYYDNPVSINFVIEVSDPSTTLTITKPTGGQTSIDPTQTLTFYLFYKDGGQGIPGLAQNNWTIDIQPGNPSSNLVIPNPTEVVGDPGNYTTTTQVGADVDTYSITFTANGTHLGYAVASTFFVLSVVPVLTNFIVSIPGQTYQAQVNTWVNLTLHYEESDGTPIQGAEVWEEPGTPPELTVQLLSTQTNSTGDFNASVRASAPGAFSVTFKANKTAYADGFTYFTLATGAQPAHLVITNPGSPTQATIGVGQSYTLNMTYETTPAPGTGLPGADWNITVDPNIGWKPPDPTDEGGGNYSVVLAPPSAGTYTIVFTANYSGYTDGVTFFTLLMGDIPATLTVSPESTGIFADGWATFTLWYKNGTTGIPGATIARSISPSGPTLNVEDNGGGKYTASGSFGDPNTYTIRFIASKTNYTDGRVTAVLNVALRPTQLEITSPSAAEIIAEETYPLKVKYTSYGSGIGGGSVSVLVTPTTGMTYEPGEHLGSGIYQIVLHGDSVGTYTITVTLSRYHYQQASVNFFLTVKPIPTTLNILELQGSNLTTSLAQPINETFQVMLNFARDENASRPVENATISLLGVEEWRVAEYLGNGTYLVEVSTGETLGIYPILAMASKSNYEVGRAAFELYVRPFSTELLFWGSEEASATVPVGETLELEVYYNNTDWGEPISGAELVISGLPLTNERTITWEQIGDTYRVAISTGILPETKPFTLTITGRHPPQFDPASITFELTIVPIPFRAQNQPPAVPGAEPTLAQSISVVEDQNANVTIQLWDTYHNTPIEDAEVIWTLYVPETEEQGTAKAAAGSTPTISFMTVQSPEGERASGEFDYIGNGTYVAFVSARGLDPGTYRLEVSANKELYGEQTFTMDYVVTPKPGTPTTYFLGLASIIVGSIGGFYSWYFYFRWPPQVRYIRKALKRMEAGSQVEEGRFPSKEEHRQAITEEQLRLPRQLSEPSR